MTLADSFLLMPSASVKALPRRKIIRSQPWATYMPMRSLILLYFPIFIPIIGFEESGCIQLCYTRLSFYRFGTIYISTDLEISRLQLLPHPARVIFLTDCLQLCQILSSVTRKHFLLQRCVIFVEEGVAKTLLISSCVGTVNDVPCCGEDCGII
jgi:hypothetical protein